MKPIAAISLLQGVPAEQQFTDLRIKYLRRINIRPSVNDTRKIE